MAAERAVLRRYLSRSPAATEALGAALGRELEAGSVLALDGDLGSGKTCFVRGLARGLGIEAPVTSPSYALLQSYPGRLELHHLDAWMEGRERAFLLDGGLEWLHARGVAVIEWGSRVEELLPEPRWSIRFEHRGESSREIEIACVGTGTAIAAARARVAELSAQPELELLA
jgi:tRNA threonylcarbamoyladenosine biosynthesis protein TsaE